MLGQRQETKKNQIKKSNQKLKCQYFLIVFQFAIKTTIHWNELNKNINYGYKKSDQLIADITKSERDITGVTN